MFQMNVAIVAVLDVYRTVSGGRLYSAYCAEKSGGSRQRICWLSVTYPLALMLHNVN